MVAQGRPRGAPLHQGGLTGWHNVITLASLVEKETPEASERPLVAGVFERRLALGMPLQCDPTVVYAAQLEDRPMGPITQTDLQLNSPYNTYRHTGLPPGPIANPGEASIRAALYPPGTRSILSPTTKAGTSSPGPLKNINATWHDTVAK